MAGPKQSSAGTTGRRPSASSAKARKRAEQAAKAASVAPPLDTALPLARADLWVAAGVAGASMLVFLSTFSSRAGLGDAPESVAGVRSLGILHAPGYVTYVVAARLFGEVFRFGGWEFRVNLFSLVCAVLSVAGVYLLARCFGANKVGAAIGALALATTSSFWFNADFAKYYSFSALLLTVMALCVLLWLRTGRGSLLVVAGVLLGSSLGVSWQIAVIMAAGLACVVVLHRPRPGLVIVLVAGGAALVTAVGVCVFILVRAGQDPTVNFGNATKLSRLFELLTTADFHGARAAAGNGSGATGVNLAIIGRDISLGAIALGFVGTFDLYVRRRLDYALFFAVVALGNVFAVSLVGGKVDIAGFGSGLTTGGQLVDAFIVVAVLAALGATYLLEELEAWQAERAEGGHAALWRGAVVALMVLVAVVPSVVFHHEPATHRIPPLGDRYARRILAALPKNSVFMTGGYEYGQPVVDRQVVHGDRPDVTVVYADDITFAWYRDQLIHRLNLDPALQTTTAQNTVTRFEIELRKSRPVYVDTYAMLHARTLYAYEAEGLVARLVDGDGQRVSPKLEAAATALQRAGVEDGMTGLKYNRFPNINLYFFYERAHIELAKQYALQDDLDRAADELQRALGFATKSVAVAAQPTIDAARAHQAAAKQVILNL